MRKNRLLAVLWSRMSLIAALLLVSSGVALDAEQGRVSPVNAVLAISEMKFCKGDALGDSVVFTGSVTARNMSSQPIVHLPGARVSKILIFDTRDSVTGARWSMDPHDVGTVEGGSVKESQFRVTRSGSSFKFPVQGFFLIAEKGSADALGPGDHWLRVVLDPLDIEMDARLRSKLETKGTLWEQPTLSEPVLITIPAHPRVRECDPLGQ